MAITSLIHVSFLVAVCLGLDLGDELAKYNEAIQKWTAESKSWNSYEIREEHLCPCFDDRCKAMTIVQNFVCP